MSELYNLLGAYIRIHGLTRKFEMNYIQVKNKMTVKLICYDFLRITFLHIPRHIACPKNQCQYENGK